MNIIKQKLYKGLSPEIRKPSHIAQPFTSSVPFSYRDLLQIQEYTRKKNKVKLFAFERFVTDGLSR